MVEVREVSDREDMRDLMEKIRLADPTFAG